MIAAVELEVLAGIRGRSIEVVIESSPDSAAGVAAFPISDLVVALIDAHSVPGSGMVSEGGRDELVAAHEEMVKAAQVLQSALARDHALAALRGAG